MQGLKAGKRLRHEGLAVVNCLTHPYPTACRNVETENSPKWV
ncbi:MAG: hypothetical protein AB9861_01470 [Methanosarcina sp.]